MPRKDRLRRLLQWLWERFSRLNLFSHQSYSERRIRIGRYITWLYLVLFSVTILIMTLYTALSVQIQTGIVHNLTESLYEQIQMKYPYSLSCPCSHLAIDYNEFIRVTPLFHQICSSEFISSTWLDILGKASARQRYRYYLDFRIAAIGQFQLLTSFCELANRTITDALNLFDTNQFISVSILPSMILVSRAQSIVNTFTNITVSSFRRQLQLMQAAIQGNQVLTADINNFYLNVTETLRVDIVPTYVINTDGTLCWCTVQNDCMELIGFFDYNASMNTRELLFNVPGLVFGCFPLDSLSFSSLECFYNQSCLNQILAHLPSSNITALNFIEASHFHRNSTIGDLLNEMFIEDWISNISYSSYYTACASSFCTYTYMGRANLRYIYITIFGLFGGLKVIFRLLMLLSILLLMVRRHSTDIVQTNNVPVGRRWYFLSLWNTIKIKITTLNLFPDRSDDDEISIRAQHYATRLYIVLFSIIIIVLVTVTSLSPQQNIQTIHWPQRTDYEYLQIFYPNTLNCPCSQVTITYNRFIYLKPSLHQVCSTIFISPDWISYTFHFYKYVFHL